MISFYDLKEITCEEILAQSVPDTSKAEQTVREIIAAVREKGDEALYFYNEKFDGKTSSLKVTQEEIDRAVKNTDPYFLETLRQARDNISEYHSAQIRQGYEIKRGACVLGQKITPLAKVGLYVPGGTARYPSTVLMNAIPARLAGVKEIAMVTPPDKNGNVPDVILAAASISGVTSVYKTGGAQAVAALAYGTETVPKVDKIVGPGNIYVAAAKKEVFGLVDIDMIAGPSEILVIADGKSPAKFVAADLLSQAEHDVNATAVLITDSRRLAEEVKTELYRQLDKLPRKEIAASSIERNGKIILAEDLLQAVDVANRIAPEHLELCVEEPFSLLDKVVNAGSVFLGRYSPEPLGDYFAGTNHTLPTSGTARFSSPLNVDDFVKKSSYIYYDKASLLASGERIADFADREGLGAHAEAIRIRMKNE